MRTPARLLPRLAVAVAAAPAVAAIPKITMHDVRRSCASLLAGLDVYPRVAMRIMRHAQIDVTMNVYTEVSDAKTLQASNGSQSNSTSSRVPPG